MSRIVVGVDAGGTSTVAAVAKDGRFLRAHQAVAANASSKGIEAASNTIAQAILAALDGALPDAIFVGAAGAGRSEVAQGIEQTLQSRFPEARVRVRDDGYIALRAVVPEGDGAVLVAGTGSIAYAQRGDREFRCGGYGYLFGDEGSGFAIGNAALKVLLRALDERVPRDAFAQSLAAELRVETTVDALTRIYSDSNPVALVASLAPFVIEAANAGDRTATKIVQGAAQDLSELAKAIVKRAGLAESGAPLVFAGGMLRRNSLLTYLLETRLRNDLPQMPIHKEDVEPYAGALAAAERLL
jgi:glucosamine kinase